VFGFDHNSIPHYHNLQEMKTPLNFFLCLLSISSTLGYAADVKPTPVPATASQFVEEPLTEKDLTIIRRLAFQVNNAANIPTPLDPRDVEWFKDVLRKIGIKRSVPQREEAIEKSINYWLNVGKQPKEGVELPVFKITDLPASIPVPAPSPRKK